MARARRLPRRARRAGRGRRRRRSRGWRGDELMVDVQRPAAVRGPGAASRCGSPLALRDRVWELAEELDPARLRPPARSCGVALGHATIGRIGSERRWEYAPVGHRSRRWPSACAEPPPPGQILISQRVFAAVRVARDHVDRRRRPGTCAASSAHTAPGTSPCRKPAVRQLTRRLSADSAVRLAGSTLPSRRLRSLRRRTRRRRRSRLRRRRRRGPPPPPSPPPDQPPPL